MSNDINSSMPSVNLSQPLRAVQGSDKVRPESVSPAPAEIKAGKPDPQEIRRQLQEATEQLNRHMANNKRDLSFSVDEKADKVVVTVKDAKGDVVRQIPDETALRVAHNLDNLKGLLQDKKI